VKALASACALLLAVAILLGCGGNGEGGEEADIPGGADPEEAQVIRDWSDALRNGDVEAAADYFEVPSFAQNPVPVQLRSHEDVVAFNEALPCGAELTKAETEGRYTIATFELTERPGRGKCGTGTGAIAKTAFKIEDGLITEWRRVADQPLPQDEGPIV
jgi:limonene-1,2-epoxide hydrolase